MGHTTVFTESLRPGAHIPWAVNAVRNLRGLAMIWMDLLKMLFVVFTYAAVLLGGIWVVRWMGRRERH
jgi:hypothetical protein